MLLQPIQRGARRVNLEQSLLYPRLEVDVDGAHVAHDLRARFLVGKEQRVLATTARCVEELRADAAFARARRTGHEHAAAAEDALAAEHLVKPRDAREDPRRGGLVI